MGILGRATVHKTSARQFRFMTPAAGLTSKSSCFFFSGDAEIISIDAFNKLHYGNGVVVGISFVKVNIYLHTSRYNSAES